MCFDIENDGLEAHLGSKGGLLLAESSSVLERVRAIHSLKMASVISRMSGCINAHSLKL